MEKRCSAQLSLGKQTSSGQISLTCELFYSLVVDDSATIKHQFEKALSGSLNHHVYRDHMVGHDYALPIANIIALFSSSSDMSASPMAFLGDLATFMGNAGRAKCEFSVAWRSPNPGLDSFALKKHSPYKQFLQYQEILNLVSAI
jgi:hypothetical protein